MTAPETFDVLFAGVPVSDFGRALKWYQHFFARPPDVIAHDEEVMWQVAAGGWLYIVRDAARAGGTSVAVAVPALEAAVSAIAGRGVTAGPIETVGEGTRKSVALDPDGNSIAIIEVAGAG